MKKTLFVLALLLAMTVQAQNDTIGVSKFTAIYQYCCKTTNAAGEPVTDSLLIAVQTANGVTKSFPYNSYNKQTKKKTDSYYTQKAAQMHMGDVFLNYPEGRITVQEELYPSLYQTDEPLQMPKWNLSEQEDSIFGYLCRAAETIFRGKTWKAFYTEEVPASIGPWKLGGLPGMITKVEDKEGIHSFTLCGLLNEEQPLIFTEYLNWFVPQMNSGKMSMARQRIDYQKMAAKKFLKHKKKVLGNPRYVQNPTYYAPSAMEAFGYREHLYTGLSDKQIISVAGVVVLSEGHAYQPLEIE
jgi:GLPGLI family protein